MEVGVAWRRGYVQFWRAFKCRCWCSVCMYWWWRRYRLQSDWLFSSKFWRRREKLCEKTIPSSDTIIFPKKVLATMLLMAVPEPQRDPSYWTQSPTTFLDTKRVVWKKLCCIYTRVYYAILNSRWNSRFVKGQSPPLRAIILVAAGEAIQTVAALWTTLAVLWTLPAECWTERVTAHQHDAMYMYSNWFAVHYSPPQSSWTVCVMVSSSTLLFPVRSSTQFISTNVSIFTFTTIWDTLTIKTLWQRWQSGTLEGAAQDLRVG